MGYIGSVIAKIAINSAFGEVVMLSGIIYWILDIGK